jgi:transcription elongation factor/antiterminator RfaH
VRDGARWYVVQTAARGEALALRHLANQAFETFCPRVRRTRRHARKFTTALEPLFPGYVFVRLDVGRQPWRSINGTAGVVRLVTDAAGPLPLPDGLIEQVRALAGGAEAPVASPGGAVRVRNGPFVDLVGRVVALAPGQRVRVLLRVMNREVTVEAALADLDPCGAAAAIG